MTAPGLPPGVGRLVWRSLPIQAAFNAETLQGAGFACAVLPDLRRAHAENVGARAAALAGGFNANPYLAPFALGAVAVAEGHEPSDRVDRFLRLVRGPLGALGDALFWGTARPALFVPAALGVVAGGPWWLAAIVLAAFNGLAFGARVSTARAGLARGLEAAAWLTGSWIRRAPRHLRGTGAVAVGLLAGVLLARAVGLPGGGMREPAVAAAWPVLLAFALSVPLFAWWPTRLGWGTALLALWGLVEALSRWTASAAGVAA
ncbi:MAG: PTS system mannose/fructose/sorbose family transporter subunit IID [Gemmatimonadota bacterium]